MAKSSRTVLLSCVLLISMCVQSLAQDCSSYRFSSNENFASCSNLPVLSSHLHWNFHPSNNTVDIAFRRTSASASNWIAWGLNPAAARMAGSQALMAFRLSNGTMRAYPTNVDSLSPSMQPGNISFGVPSIRAEYNAGNMIIFATLQLNGNLLSTNQVWQEGPVQGDSPTPHATNSENMQSVGTIDFRSGATSGGGNSRIHKRNVHGVLNAVSWGILMPIGIIIARYLKVSKAAGAAWFYLHVACQSSAYVIGVAGWATGIKLGKDSPGVTYHKHRNIGITLFCLGTLQVFALLLRPKPEHKYRMYWNFYHWTVGYATIILSIINIYEGFDVLDGQKNWKWAYTGIIIFLGATAALLEAFTWFIVLRRKKSVSSDKYGNGENGVNGYGNRSHQTV